MFSLKTLLVKNRPMLAIWKSPSLYNMASKRAFCSTSQVETVSEEEKGVEHMSEDERLIAMSKKFGADLSFDNRKHSYILSFPWNFDDVIKDFQQDFTPLREGNPWHRWVFNRECDRDFNELFRTFHQACAIPEESGLDKACEPRLKKYMMKSLETIHFHGMDMEMANLTVHQPKIEILNVEVSHGISVDRSENKPLDAYEVSESTFMGAPLKKYVDKTNRKGLLDNLDENYKPYLVSVTTLIHSPMKLYVLNQNRTKVLFGSNDKEEVKNVVKFEANVKWSEFLKILPVANKPLLGRAWKITDYNNVMNENPYF